MVITMSTVWTDLLEEAKGRSEYVIAINIDIRGFTPFSLSVESIDLGQYIKRLYAKILSKYFPDAVFSKPMGDGLFIIYYYEEESVKEMVNKIVQKCINLEKEFHSLLKDDPMIVFNTPSKIGIGVTRGTTCCIYNGDNIIDYSGKILNHAARLMEKARPSGVICDYISFYNILNDDLSKLFEEESACLRGVAESEPIKILVQKNKVKISEIDRRPLNEVIWEIVNKEYSVRYIKSAKEWFSISLDKKPLNKNEIYVEIRCNTYRDGELVEGMATFEEYDITSQLIQFQQRGPNNYIKFNFILLREEFQMDSMPDEETVRFEISYPI